MKKLTAMLAGLILLAGAAAAQGQFEFSLGGGYNLMRQEMASSFSNTTTTGINYLTKLSSMTTIAGTPAGAPFAGISLAYFFSPNLGLEIAGGMAFKSKTPLPSTFTLSWTWNAQAGGQSYTETYPNSDSPELWPDPVDSELSATVISLNLIGRFGTGALQGYVSGGPTVFLNSFQGSSTVGIGDSVWFTIYPYTFQFVDAYQVALEIPKTSFTTFGADIGAGAVYKFTPQVGIFIDARYYFSGAKELQWEYGSGTYDGIFGYLVLDMTQDVIDYINENYSIQPLKINPSFLKIGGGLKFSF